MITRILELLFLVLFAELKHVIVHLGLLVYDSVKFCVPERNVPFIVGSNGF